MIADVVTASFEVGAAAMTALNVKTILRDKRVSGVSIWPTLFFGAWGIWNLWFFPHVGAPLAGACAGLVALGNFTWIVLALKFKLEETVL